ncbi:class I SAM-dependent methyltransferase [Microbulbifer guangxiensis]|uniref:class I SAM-dependent methyltransferase n=1 Tax=Microbulbifer guangxiensis TaxID=2904249 RepID=UPI001F269DEE|nr:class I SAM-dependent methyltransferase [Microbulbifer guangxiensis]
MQHHSLGLAALNQEIIQPGYRILDLGPLAVGTTQAFLQKNCPCYIEDLIEFFADSDGAPDPRAALAKHLVPKPERIKFDVILCWDLLNFLSPELIAHLLELLRPNLKPGTLLHAMIYTGARAPSRPARFRLLQDFTYETSDDPDYPLVPYQRHTTMTLMRSLGRFRLSDSLVKRRGMRSDLFEYFFEYESGTPTGKVRPGGAPDVSSYFSSSTVGSALRLSALDRALESARRSPVSRVVDCGPRTGRNTGALQQQVGELFLLDLHNAIQWYKRRGQAGSEAIRAAFAKFSGMEPADILLTWDLFSFYTPDEVRVLSELLLEKLKPGGHLHLLFCKRASRTKSPSVFEVQVDRGILVKEFPASGEPAIYSSLTGLIRSMPHMQLAGQGHGKLPGGAIFHELALKKTTGA